MKREATVEEAGKSNSIVPVPLKFGQSLSYESFEPNILEIGPPPPYVSPVSVMPEIAAAEI